jgi:hypothetical protein
MNKKEFKKARKANGHLMGEKAEVRKVLQEEFGHELGDVNAGKIYEVTAGSSARKGNKKK